MPSLYSAYSAPMDKLKDSLPEKAWLALQVLQDTYPLDTEAVVDYLAEVTGELAKMTEFLCRRQRHRDIDQDWPQAKERIEEARSLLGLQGKKILATCGPEPSLLS